VGSFSISVTRSYSGAAAHVKKKKLFASLIIFTPLQFFFPILFISSFLACRKLTKSSGTLIKNCLIHRPMNRMRRAFFFLHVYSYVHVSFGFVSGLKLFICLKIVFSINNGLKYKKTNETIQNGFF
jgi:hypothetical protein